MGAGRTLSLDPLDLDLVMSLYMLLLFIVHKSPGWDALSGYGEIPKLLG